MGIFFAYTYIYIHEAEWAAMENDYLPPLVSRYMVSRWNLARRIWHVDAPRNDRLLP